MSDQIYSCPACSATTTRILTRQELRARNDGRDPLVVVSPRICAACGHVWEPPPSKAMCYFVVVIAGIGATVGTLIVAGAVWILVAAAFAEPGPANTLANRAKVSAMGLLGIGLAGGGWAMARKYVQIAREQAEKSS